MHLFLPTPPERYKSKAQRARVSTEPWVEENLFCPSCPSPKLSATSTGTEAVDFVCPRCEETFQLKSQGHALGRRIVDAAYDAMMRALLRDATPNLLALHYDAEQWRVANLLLIPRFVFSPAAIEKRPPLSSHARRAGWVGCNIVLDAIPTDARIHVVRDGSAVSPSDVRRQYKKLTPLAKLKVAKRGWTLDVLRAIEGLPSVPPASCRLAETRQQDALRPGSGQAGGTKKNEFTLAEVYSTEEHLAKLHPGNRHIRAKIRQQLQVLRDLGFIEFLGGGTYRSRG